MLTGFWIRNYKSLRQVGIGSCFSKFVFVNLEKEENEKDIHPHDLGPVTLLTGANGTGKSTTIDAFSFISDTYRYGVDVACLKRGGFDAIYSQGSKGPIAFGFQYQQKGEADTVTYAVSVYRTKNKVPFIESEVLAYQRGDESLPILFLQNGAEKSIRYLAPDERLSNAEYTKIEFTDHNHLGLAALASHPKYPVLASLRFLFENWTLCHFTPDPARGLDKSLPRRCQESLRGISLSGLVRYITKRYKNNLRPLFLRVAKAIPNVESILLDDTDPDKPLLAFQLTDRDNPVPITHLSAAVVRLFTYTLLLEEEEPAPVVMIEEPENGLDRTHRNKILETLHHFAAAARPDSSQTFLTTHHPAIANGLHPSQVWVFEKDRDGFTAVERASDSIMFPSTESQDDPQWFSTHFDEKR
jgi:predicted ATPase